MDVATKILPHIAPVVLDAERDVRATAMQCLKVYVGKLETASAKVGQPQQAQDEEKTEIALATDKVLDSVSWLSGAAVSKLTAAVNAAAGGDKGGAGGGGAGGGGGGGGAPAAFSGGGVLGGAFGGGLGLGLTTLNPYAAGGGTPLRCGADVGPAGGSRPGSRQQARAPTPLPLKTPFVTLPPRPRP